MRAPTHMALGVALVAVLAPAAAFGQAIFTEPVRLSEPLVTTGDFAINGAAQHWVPMAFDDDGDAITMRMADPVSFAHYDVTDPAGTHVNFNPGFYTQRPPNVVRSLGSWTMSFDHSGIWFNGIDDERAELKLVVDGDYDNATVYSFPLAEYPDWQAMYERLLMESSVTEPAPGTLCIRTARLVHCADLEAGTLEVAFDAAVIDEVVGALPHLEGSAAGSQDDVRPEYLDLFPDHYAPLDWTLDDVQFVPDGRLYVLATGVRQAGSAAGNHIVRALLEVSAAGEVAVRYGPLKSYGDFSPGYQVSGASTNPLGGADTLLYLPEYDAIAVHTHRASYGWVSAYTGGTGFIIHLEDFGSASPHGWQGHGLHLFPLDAPGHGLLDLTDAMIRRYECAEGGTASNGCRLNGPRLLFDRGELRVVMPHVPTYNNFLDNFATVHALELDPALLDLDQDGLTAGREDAAGTSDYLFDTDGGGNDDLDEVLRAGTDPNDPADDPVAMLRLASPVRLVSSPMIRLRLPETSLQEGPGMVSWAASGPLCERGVCVDASGATVLEYGDLDGLESRFPPIRAVDASHLVVQTVDGFARVFFDDGHRELWLTTEEILAAFPHEAASAPLQYLTVIPVDAQHTWIVRESDPARVVLFEDRVPRVVYDHEQARCDSQLGPCDPGPRPSAPDLDQTTGGGGLPGGGLSYGSLPHHDVEQDRMVFIGYEARTGQVLIGVYGTWQTYLVAVHAEADPMVVATERELMSGATGGTRYPDNRIGPPRLPTGWLPLDEDLRLTPEGIRDPFGAPVAGSLEAFHSYGQTMTTWGDTTLYRVYSGAPEDGPYELVRYSSALEPNDIVIASIGGAAPKDNRDDADVCTARLRVFHGKARGGLVERFTACVPWMDASAVTSSSPLTAVAGIDVTADGLMCVAGGDRVVVWTGTASTGGFPQVPLWDVPLDGAVDCAWDDGRLLALTGPPATVHLFDASSETGFAPETTLVAPDPSMLLRGFLRLPDGRTVVVFEGGSPEPGVPPERAALALDGSEVDVEAAGAAAGVPEPSATWEPGLRSDGFVITNDAGRLDVTDLFTGSHAPFAWEDFGGRGSFPTQMAFAVVPGAAHDRRDPWTGQLRTAATVAERQPLDPGADPGGPIGGDTDAGGEDCACRVSSAGGSGGPGPWTALLAVVALAVIGARRRRGTTIRT